MESHGSSSIERRHYVVKRHGDGAAAVLPCQAPCLIRLFLPRCRQVARGWMGLLNLNTLTASFPVSLCLAGHLQELWPGAGPADSDDSGHDPGTGNPRLLLRGRRVQGKTDRVEGPVRVGGGLGSGFGLVMMSRQADLLSVPQHLDP